jgi:hypothetical protein
VLLFEKRNAGDSTVQSGLWGRAGKGLSLIFGLKPGLPLLAVVIAAAKVSNHG